MAFMSGLNESIAQSNSTIQCQQPLQIRVPQSKKPFIVAIFGSIALTATCFNVMVFIVYFRTRSLSKPCNKLLLSLALIDLLVGLIVAPISIRNLFVADACLRIALQKVYQFLICVSCVTLCNISYDRYLFFTKPGLYADIMRGFRLRCTIAMPWSSTLILMTASLLPEKVKFWIAVMVILVGYLFYFTCYTFIYKRLMARMRLWQSREEGSHTQMILKETQRSMHLILLLIICNFICTFPWFLCLLFFLLSQYSLVNTKQLEKEYMFLLIGVICMQLKSAINPIIYFAVSKDFFTALQRIVRSQIRPGTGNQSTANSSAQIYCNRQNRRSEATVAINV